MEQIVNSYNLFVDSSHAVTSGSKGDDFHVNLQDSGVHAGDGQIIRVNLQEFSMKKNFFDVNATNSRFKVYGFAADVCISRISKDQEHSPYERKYIK